MKSHYPFPTVNGAHQKFCNLLLSTNQNDKSCDLKPVIKNYLLKNQVLTLVNHVIWSFGVLRQSKVSNLTHCDHHSAFLERFPKTIDVTLSLSYIVYSITLKLLNLYKTLMTNSRYFENSIVRDMNAKLSKVAIISLKVSICYNNNFVRFAICTLKVLKIFLFFQIPITRNL